MSIEEREDIPHELAKAPFFLLLNFMTSCL
jgi:hypothetical protein